MSKAPQHLAAFPRLKALREALGRPRDVSLPVLVRFAYGMLVCISALRFLAYGWVDDFFVKPTFMFKYLGFEWVTPLSSAGMRGVFATLAVTGFAVAVGAFYRVSLSVLLIAFAYIHLLDVTNYLNHYYLVLLLGCLLWTMPVGRALSVDAWRYRERRLTAFPAWCIYLLRFQVSTVYFFAGMAKFNTDWLLHAEPLNIWLSSLSDLPVLGNLFVTREAAYFMSWAGFLFDTFVWMFLLWKPTRPFAFAAVVVFHLLTAKLFPIGMFPFIMMSAALVFFDRVPGLSRFLEHYRQGTPALPSGREHGIDPPAKSGFFPISSAGLLALGLYALVQLALPLRHLAYGSDSVLWHEQGMRFSWRVMAREKNGSVTYLVDGDAIHQEVPASRYLDDRQLRDFSTQPDLILQLAHRIRDDYARAGHSVRVRAEAYASWNGRARALLIDPTVDLGREHDTLAAKRWIAAAPHEAPLHLRPLAHSP